MPSKPSRHKAVAPPQSLNANAVGRNNIVANPTNLLSSIGGILGWISQFTEGSEQNCTCCAFGCFPGPPDFDVIFFFDACTNGFVHVSADDIDDTPCDNTLQTARAKFIGLGGSTKVQQVSATAGDNIEIIGGPTLLGTSGVSTSVAVAELTYKAKGSSAIHWTFTATCNARTFDYTTDQLVICPLRH